MANDNKTNYPNQTSGTNPPDGNQYDANKPTKTTTEYDANNNPIKQTTTKDNQPTDCK